MKYLICQDWINTSNNHAGMKHMCQLLQQYYPDEYRLIVFPDLLFGINFQSFYQKLYGVFMQRIIIPYKYKKIARRLRPSLNPNDKVYLLEYCTLTYEQYSFAKYLKTNVPDVSIFGLVHIIPQSIEQNFDDNKLSQWFSVVDYVCTLGSSLSEYLVNVRHIEVNKVKTLFHYVDLDYYKPFEKSRFLIDRATVRIIVMGNQKRNFNLLKQIVDKCPTVTFVICQGVLNLNEFFSENFNVELKGFMDEPDLLKLMQESDISLNVMDDTIGSNVITTSMAAGLAMIVSDVGSIRDYCGSDGAMYCNNDDIDTFSSAIIELIENRAKLDFLKQKSLEYSKKLSILNLHKLL